MVAYSIDIRKPVVNTVLNGKKIKEISESLAIHTNTISKDREFQDESDALCLFQSLRCLY